MKRIVKPSIAPSLSSVPQSRIRELADIAMSMDGVLRLYFGESNQPTPQYIKDAAVRALNEGYTFYTENAGLPSLRRAIAAKYREIHGIDLDWRNVVVTASGVQALNLSIRCVLDPGAEAVILTPAWPNGTAIVGMSCGSAIQVPHVLEDDHYAIDFEAVESAISERTKLVLYTSPSNPLGWVAKESDQDHLLEICRSRGLWLLADEVYERIYFGAEAVAPSILRKCSSEDAVIVVQSFSKSYCMTGWRLGWLVARRDVAEKAAQLNEFIVSHAPSMAQKAAETALIQGEGEIRAMVERLRDNRDFVRRCLRGMPGLIIPQAEGAFYLFPRIEGVDDSFDFCRRLLLEKKVGIAPGGAFGQGGEGSVRICFAADKSVLEPAMERLHSFLAGRPIH